MPTYSIVDGHGNKSPLGEISLKELYLQAPESQVDPELLCYVRKWGDEPTAIQALELLDQVVWTGGASGYFCQTLRVVLDKKLADEGITFEQLCEQAPWRKNILDD